MKWYVKVLDVLRLRKVAAALVGALAVASASLTATLVECHRELAWDDDAQWEDGQTLEDLFSE